MESMLPKIKKKISSYIKSETGQISKQSILTIGAFVGTAALASLAAKPASATLTADISPEGNPVTLTGSHVSHDSGGCGESCGGESCTADYECGTCMSVCQYADMQDGGQSPPEGCTIGCEVAAQPCGESTCGLCMDICQGYQCIQGSQENPPG